MESRCKHLFIIAVNNFDAKYASCSQVFLVTELVTRRAQCKQIPPFHLIEGLLLTTRKDGDPCPPRLLFFAKTSSLLFFLIMLAWSKNCQHCDLNIPGDLPTDNGSLRLIHIERKQTFSVMLVFFYRFPFCTVWMALYSSLLNLDRFNSGFLRVHEVSVDYFEIEITQHSVKWWRCQLPYSFCPVSSPRPSSFYW